MSKPRALRDDEILFCHLLKRTGDRAAAWRGMRPAHAADTQVVALAGAGMILARMRESRPDLYAGVIADVQGITPDLADLELMAGLQDEDPDRRQRAAQTALRRYGREAPVKQEHTFPHLVPESEEWTSVEQQLSDSGQSSGQRSAVSGQPKRKTPKNPKEPGRKPGTRGRGHGTKEKGGSPPAVPG